MRAFACVLTLALGASAFPHRLDEYLQLTAISVEKGRVRARMYLTPGVAVVKRVIALIDANGDGVLSEGEEKAYAIRVMRDVSLTGDGARVSLRLLTYRFPKLDEMRQGVGEIEIDLEAPLRGGVGGHHLAFENRHQSHIAAYLVECFVPTDPDIRIVGQSRSPEQARYEVRYAQAAPRRPGTIGRRSAQGANLHPALISKRDTESPFR